MKGYHLICHLSGQGSQGGLRVKRDFRSASAVHVCDLGSHFDGRGCAENVCTCSKGAYGEPARRGRACIVHAAEQCLCEVDQYFDSWNRRCVEKGKSGAQCDAKKPCSYGWICEETQNTCEYNMCTSPPKERYLGYKVTEKELTKGPGIFDVEVKCTRQSKRIGTPTAHCKQAGKEYELSGCEHRGRPRKNPDCGSEKISIVGMQFETIFRKTANRKKFCGTAAGDLPAFESTLSSFPPDILGYFNKMCEKYMPVSGDIRDGNEDDEDHEDDEDDAYEAAYFGLNVFPELTESTSLTTTTSMATTPATTTTRLEALPESTSSTTTASKTTTISPYTPSDLKQDAEEFVRLYRLASYPNRPTWESFDLCSETMQQWESRWIQIVGTGKYNPCDTYENGCEDLKPIRHA